MIDSFILKIKRGDTAFYRGLRDLIKRMLSGTLPLPRAMHPILSGLYSLHSAVRYAIWRTWIFLWVEPLFRGRCVSIGKRFQLWNMPEVTGHTRIYIGDDVTIFGKIGVYSGRIFDEPKLIIKDRVGIGHNVTIVVNKEIVIEEDVHMATGVRVMDSDGHPRDTEERAAGLPPNPEEIKPVRVCRGAWIGQNTFIMKGVTIGEGAVVGVNSVVLTDVPAFCTAIGNPARVVSPPWPGKNKSAPSAASSPSKVNATA